MKSNGTYHENDKPSFSSNRGNSDGASSADAGGGGGKQTTSLDWYTMVMASESISQQQQQQPRSSNVDNSSSGSSHKSDTYRPKPTTSTNSNQEFASRLRTVEDGVQAMDLNSRTAHYQQPHPQPQQHNQKTPDEQQYHDFSAIQSKRNSWARIASQPARMQMTFHNSAFKKKCPGMPPGPIVPGKHNIEPKVWTGPAKPLVAPPALPPNPQLLAKPQPILPPASTPAYENRDSSGAGTAISAASGYPKPAQPLPLSQSPKSSDFFGNDYDSPKMPMCFMPVNKRTIFDSPHRGGPKKSYESEPSKKPATSLAAAAAAAAAAHFEDTISIANETCASLKPLESHSNHSTAATTMTTSSAGANNGNCSNNNDSSALVHPVLDQLGLKNKYNPKEFDLMPADARFFVIKSYSEDDIHRSIKYEIWCSTERGNSRLDRAFGEQQERNNGPIYLFFSVNGSGHFCGMAQMMSKVDYNNYSSVWAQDKWKGQFRVFWIYVKDVPNNQLRNIKLENNENKPFTTSRDTQEVPYLKGCQVLRIIHNFSHSTSIFDDFIHYEKLQEEVDSKKRSFQHQHQQQHQQQQHGGGSDSGLSNKQPYQSQHAHSQQYQHRRPPQFQHSGGGGGGGGGSCVDSRSGDHFNNNDDNYDSSKMLHKNREYFRSNQHQM